MRRPRAARPAAVKAFTRDDLVGFHAALAAPRQYWRSSSCRPAAGRSPAAARGALRQLAGACRRQGNARTSSRRRRGRPAAHRAGRPAGLAAVGHPRRPGDADRSARGRHGDQQRQRRARRQLPVADQHGFARDQGLVLRRQRHRRSYRPMPFPTSSPRRCRPTAPAIRSARCRQDIRAFLATKGVTDEELSRTIANGINAAARASSRPRARCWTAMQTNALYGRPDDYYELLGDKYRAQTRASSMPRCAARSTPTVSSGSSSATPPRSGRSSTSSACRSK